MTPERVGERLAALYRDIHASAMRDAPICNDALEVEAIGFRDHAGYVFGVVVTPWFLNLVAVRSDADDAPALPAVALRLRFPAGDMAFTVSGLAGFGPLASCSLISPMAEVVDQEAARAAAWAALDALFDPALHAPPAGPRKVVDRRGFFGGGRGPAPGEETAR